MKKITVAIRYRNNRIIVFGLLLIAALIGITYALTRYVDTNYHELKYSPSEEAYLVATIGESFGFEDSASSGILYETSAHTPNGDLTVVSLAGTDYYGLFQNDALVETGVY